MQHHNYSLTELDNMMPWEREIYVGLLMEWIEEEKRKLENEKLKSKLSEDKFRKFVEDYFISII